MKNNKLSPWPCYTDEEANAVQRVLLSNKVNYWTGDEGRQFEREFAEWTGVEKAIALANGTVAIDLALIALGIGQGHEVIVTPRSFIASVSSVVNSGATPIFADVDLNSQNITAESIEAKLTSNTKAIVVVHLAGLPAEMDEIMALANKHGLYVIEDCAQAHGAIYKGKPVGSIGHIGAWSFCQDKIITTGGEGGMVTTNDEDLWRRMWSYKDHGKSYEAVYQRSHPPGFRWLHDSFGTNWRMTELQAVIGRIQLARMESWTESRNYNASALTSAFINCDFFRVTEVPEHSRHAYYKYYVFFNDEKAPSTWSRDRVIERLNALGVPCMQGSCSEMYLEKAFDQNYRPKHRLPNAKKLGEVSLTFLVHPTLTEEEIQNKKKSIAQVIGEMKAEVISSK